ASVCQTPPVGHKTLTVRDKIIQPHQHPRLTCHRQLYWPLSPNRGLTPRRSSGPRRVRLVPKRQLKKRGSKRQSTRRAPKSHRKKQGSKHQPREPGPKKRHSRKHHPRTSPSRSTLNPNSTNSTNFLLKVIRPGWTMSAPDDSYRTTPTWATIDDLLDKH